jgi:phytanoyl-CoA hydroxylase
MVSATSVPFTLTEHQLRQYRDEGYTVVRGLIEPELMAAVKAELMRIMHGEQDRWPIEHFQILDPEEYKNPKGGVVPVGVQLPAKNHEDFRRVQSHPNLQAAMSQILGGPVKPFTDQALIKSAWIKEDDGGQTFYHQDSYYWLLKPERGCNVWIPCDDVGPGAIGLAVMPGTHKGWKLVEHEQYFDDPKPFGARGGQPYKRHRIPPGTIDYSKEVAYNLTAGDAVFFSNFTWHRADPNKSGQHKCAYAIAYQLDDETNKFDADPRPEHAR